MSQSTLDPFAVAVQRVVDDHVPLRRLVAAYAPAHGNRDPGAPRPHRGERRRRPGRAHQGVHLDDDRRRAAEGRRGAARRPAAGRGGDQPARALPRDRARSSAPGGAPSPRPSAARSATTASGRAGAQGAGQGAALEMVQAQPVRGGLPRRASRCAEMSARAVGAVRGRDAAVEAERRGRRVARGLPRRRASRRSWPTRSACTSTRSSGSWSTRPPLGGPLHPAPRLRPGDEHHAGDLSLAQAAASPAKGGAAGRAATPPCGGGRRAARPARLAAARLVACPSSTGSTRPSASCRAPSASPVQRTFFLQARGGHAGHSGGAGEAAGADPRGAGRPSCSTS